jgi:1-acyl-sn-glycerol-3-phosphate acyltransferase
MLLSIVRVLAAIVFRLRYRIVITGKQNVPRTGAYLICANHVHALDPVVISVGIPRKPRYMSKAELFQKNRMLSGFLSFLGAYPVARGTTDMQAYRTTIDILKKGEGIIIFSQGTRMKEFEDAKAGVAVFALKTSAPIIPTGISWTRGIRPTVRINFGAPISMDEYAGQKVRTELVDTVMEKVIHAVNDLIPA